MINPQLTIMPDPGILPALIVILAMLQIVTPAILFRKGGIELSGNEGSHDPPMVPARYAFSIWGLIYAWSLAFAIYQILPSQEYARTIYDIRLFAAITFFGTTIWLVFARLKWVWVCFVCMIFILASLSIAFGFNIDYYDANRSTNITIEETLLVKALLSIFFGWITVATFANLAAALKKSRIMSDGLSEVIWSIILLLVAGASSCAVLYYSHGNLWYAGTILWALVAIIIANLKRSVYKWVAITAAVMIMAVITVILMS